MTDLEALLAGIVSEPLEETRWLVLADWLEENDDVRRGELLRLHRKLLATCCEPEAHPERKEWQARIVELIAEGVKPCVPQKTLTLPGNVPMTLLFIPPGSFLMGRTGLSFSYGVLRDDDRPLHKVTLTRGFFAGVHQVTQAHWKAVMGTDPSVFKGANRPVEKVSWGDCREFCKRLTSTLTVGRVELPTEAEWELACRAGTTTEYHFGDVLNTNLANYDGRYTWNNSPLGKNRDETTDVGSFPCNPWGLHDLHGNVFEWCLDGERDYSSDPQTDPQGNPDDEHHILRGGCWQFKPSHCAAAYRHSYPNDRYDDCGFRVCFRLE